MPGRVYASGNNLAPALGRRGFVVGTDVLPVKSSLPLYGKLPHDIKHRELTTGRSRLQALNTLGIDAVVVPESSVLDGINVVRRMLGRTWIDVNRCERGIEALRQYRREYDSKLKDWKKNPLHDFSSHACDALRTFACGFDDSATSSSYRFRRPPPPRIGTHWSA